MKHFYIYFILFIFIQKIYTEGETTNEPAPINANTFAALTKSENANKKFLNIILFISNVPKNYTFNKKVKDIWNFDLVKTMKSCSSKRRSVNLKFRRIVRRKKSICECEAALKQNLLSLMDWARESAGMLTAVVSLTEHGYSDAISSETNQNGEHYGFNYFNFKLNEISGENATNEKDDFIEFPLRPQKNIDNNDLPDLMATDDNDDIPIINAFPKPMKFNKNFQHIKKRFWSPYQIASLKDPINFMKYEENHKHQNHLHATGRNEIDYKSETQEKGENKEKTETQEKFENHEKDENQEKGENQQKNENQESQDIPPDNFNPSPETATTFLHHDTKNVTNNLIALDSPPVPDKELEDFNDKEPPPSEPSNVEELSDIMSSIKKQFFHNMLEAPTLEEQPVFKQPTMNELVKITFNHTIGAQHGYLLLFMGGSVTDLDNVNSDLGEALQYLIDHIKESNTVIIVSGGCVDTGFEDDEAANENNVPLFILGPDSETDYGKNDDLCNLPGSIKLAIQKHRIKK